jgi:transcriptional regulator with XRE-family HTH domain
MTQLGQRLKSLRTERQLTQEQVARRAGIALATYVRIETGHTPGRPGRGTSTTVLEKIARGLDVPMAALFQTDGDDETDDVPTARPA